MANNNFIDNLKKLAAMHSQKEIAQRTGFSQSSVNNYIAGVSEPSISFLINLKQSFGIDVNNFLFGEINIKETVSYDKFIGHFIVYYYNNDMYKGGVHNNVSNTLNYGVVSIFKDDLGSIKVCATMLKEKKLIVALFKSLNGVTNAENVIGAHKNYGNYYSGKINLNAQNFFISLKNEVNNDECLLIFNNPPSNDKYIGGLGTVNSISRGREFNPCIQFILISKNLVERSDGEIYDFLKLDAPVINFSTSVREIIDLVKRLYIKKDDLSTVLTDTQKEAIVENNIKYRFNEIIESNMFRFAKVSNREDDYVYKILKTTGEQHE